MSEMVERVAMAIFRQETKDSPFRKAIYGDAPSEVQWADIPDQIKHFHMERARTAIEAMREPTHAMKAQCGGDHYVLSNVIENGKSIPEWYPVAAYKRMIDEALR